MAQRLKHLSTVRVNQLPPVGDWWDIWMSRAGRGNGKTWGGAGEGSEQARLGGDGWRGLLMGRTYRDVRDVMVEGPAGLLAAIPAKYVVSWNRSLGQLILTNGAMFECFGAEDPDVIRGHEYHWAWLDELAAYTYAEDIFDAVQFTLRAGVHPRLVITTTPRPTKLIRRLEDDPLVAVTTGTMYENPHLSRIARTALEKRYGGTRLGNQELDGRIITEVAGALWALEVIEEARYKQSERPVNIDRIVVGVDPAGGGPDDIGIVTAARVVDDYLVLGDQSLSHGASPDEWGRQAVTAYVDYMADVVVAEKNYGGEMVRYVIKTAAKDMGVEVNVKLVTATRGKVVRAQPVAALYEQGRVHHVGQFAELEDQMTTWLTTDKVSPDRMDALVWGITDLMDTGDWGVS